MILARGVELANPPGPIRWDPYVVTSGTIAAGTAKRVRRGRSAAESAGSGRSPATLDPGAGSGPVRPDAAVGEPPAVVRPHQVVAVPAPVVDAAVGHGEEVTAGPGPIGPVQLDQNVAHGVPDARRPGAGSEVTAGVGGESPDRSPTPRGPL